MGARPYIVQTGDNLYVISARFGIPMDAIIDANPYINFTYPLYTGQTICFPLYATSY
jgi:LysM repeat protein